MTKANAGLKRPSGMESLLQPSRNYTLLGLPRTRHNGCPVAAKLTPPEYGTKVKECTVIDI
jgi:hypothetical protein